MCNHYRNDIRKAGRQLELYGFPEFSEIKIPLRLGEGRAEALKTDVYPDREALVARLDDNGALVPDVMRWGFPPVKNTLVTNVRNTASKFWAGWLKTEWRCLVPATSFSEWSPDPPKGERWFDRIDDDLLCFAGIWRPWTGARGTKAKPIEGEHRIFAFLTTEPNDVVAPIHPKAMPVVLAREDWDAWLTGSVEEALALQRPASNDVLRMQALPAAA